MLYLFDLDGTLISGYMDTPEKAYDTWEVLPGRKEALAELKGDGHAIAVITNQGGVAFGLVTEEHCRRKMCKALTALGIAHFHKTTPPETWMYICMGHPRGKAPYSFPSIADRRKPSPRMLQEAMRDYASAAADGVLMVGDRDEDVEAATAAGVPFMDADQFFRPWIEAPATSFALDHIDSHRGAD